LTASDKNLDKNLHWFDIINKDYKSRRGLSSHQEEASEKHQQAANNVFEKQLFLTVVRKTFFEI
jgi:hypothetical protein